MRLKDPTGRAVKNKGEGKKVERNNRTPNYSRTYDRLGEHNGTVSRLGRVGKKAKIVRNDSGMDSGYQLETDSEDPGYENRDAPITLLTKELEEGYDEMMGKDGKSKDEFIAYLMEENKKLKEMLEEAKEMGGSTKDNLFEVGMYIASGVFLIVLMEQFSKNIRRF
jgi:hypothetical protein